MSNIFVSTRMKAIISEFEWEKGRFRYKAINEEAGSIIIGGTQGEKEWKISENASTYFNTSVPFDEWDKAGYVYYEDRLSFQEIIEFSSDKISRNIRFTTNYGQIMPLMVTAVRNMNYITGKYLYLITLKNPEKESMADLQTDNELKVDLTTGVYNNSTTKLIIEKALMSNEISNCALLMIDIDLSDTMNGYKQNTTMISKFAYVLTNHFRRTDVIGRINADRFLVFLFGVSQQEQLYNTLDSLKKEIDLLFSNDDVVINSNIRIGIALRNNFENYYELYDRAETALLKINSNDKICYEFYH